MFKQAVAYGTAAAIGSTVGAVFGTAFGVALMMLISDSQNPEKKKKLASVVNIYDAQPQDTSLGDVELKTPTTEEP